jgi:V-type H+-transporting ATPase subunit a
MVHQLIEVIEFVLGSVSNTASYLRLWALSLAHSQLAEVFYSMLLEPHLSEGNIFVRVFGIAFGFMMLANVTVAVLMCMDLMECFLHALRLHW